MFWLPSVTKAVQRTSKWGVGPSVFREILIKGVAAPDLPSSSMLSQSPIQDMHKQLLKSEPALFSRTKWLMVKGVGIEPKDLISGAESTKVLVEQYTTRAPMTPSERGALLKHFVTSTNVICIGSAQGSSNNDSRLVTKNNHKLGDVLSKIKSQANNAAEDASFFR